MIKAEYLSNDFVSSVIRCKRITPVCVAVCSVWMCLQV